MFKKAIAALAVAGSLFVLAPHAALADEAATRPTATAEQPATDAATRADASAKEAFAAIEQRLAADPALARQIHAAATRGDAAQASKLLASDGAEVVAIGTQGGDAQLDRVTIRVKVTVCVRVYGTTYCGTVTITVNLD